MPEEADPKQRLIESAQHLFHARSYGTVAVQDLCEFAEVRRGSFYYYFPSKLDLALAALDADWQALRSDVFEPAFAKTAPPLDRFRRWAELAYKYYTERASRLGVMGGCPIGNLGQELNTLDGVIRSKVSEHFEAAMGYFQEALKDAVAAGDIADIDSSAAAHRVFAYTQGMLLLAQTSDDPGVIRELGLDAVAVAGLAGSLSKATQAQ